MKSNPSEFQPDCRIYLNDLTGAAVVSGFDHEQVHIHACGIVRMGYVSVSDEYVLYQHTKTLNVAPLRKLTFIKKQTHDKLRTNQ